jgi:hypothetical protein
MMRNGPGSGTSRTASFRRMPATALVPPPLAGSSRSSASTRAAIEHATLPLRAKQGAVFDVAPRHLLWTGRGRLGSTQGRSLSTRGAAPERVSSGLVEGLAARREGCDLCTSLGPRAFAGPYSATMRVRTSDVWLLAALGLVCLAGCGASEDGSSGVVKGQSNPLTGARVQTAALPVSAQSRATLLRFAGVGRLEVRCSERPWVVFRVVEKTAVVGVDTGRSRELVETLDPGERLQTRPSRSALLRWHIASSHGDGVRVVTGSVAVTPVRGGKGACLFTAQSIRGGQTP